MNLLITNDDGPLHDVFSPYIRPFVQYIKKNYPHWNITVCVPHTQKSWIGKAHLAGKTLSAQFLYTSIHSTDNSYWGPFLKPQIPCDGSKMPRPAELDSSTIPVNQTELIEWCLVDGTPASCVNIGSFHLTEHRFDLVLSGPNVGGNTSAAYITSSGTVGAAMESVIAANTKAIALSWAYFNGRKVVDLETMEMASQTSLNVINHLYSNWDDGVDLYSVNVPLIDSLSMSTRIFYAPIWENRWSSIYTPAALQLSSAPQDIEDGSKSHMISFEWAPNARTQKSANSNESNDILNDKTVVEKGMISVTPLKALLYHVNHLFGEMTIPVNEESVVISISKDDYIYNPLSKAIKKYMPNIPINESLNSSGSQKTFHYGDYEQLDMEKAMTDPQHYFINSYIYRKALIRKHFLSNTIHSYVVKHPESVLNDSYLESFTIDLDYAEFLDDALDENWELRQELEQEDSWWIVKPSMSDKGQGIRVFKSIADLQAIFDSFDEDETDEELPEEAIDDNKIVISQLRHFIVQRYLQNPLLLSSMGHKKFHIRCYITCKGNIEVYVYNRMLALFAPTKYAPPKEEDYSPTDIEQLQCHLTNTCLQTDKQQKDLSVVEFDKLPDLPAKEKLHIKKQIHSIAHDIFLAALNANRINFQPLPNAFETFGVDFLVDTYYNVKILEINAYPDFKQTGGELKELVDELFDHLANYCISPFFGHNTEEKSDNFIRVLNHSSNNW